eukprot:2716055-Pyramimonas_sp.AAC.1
MGRGGRRGPTVRHGAALASVGTVGEAAELMLLLQAKGQSAEPSPVAAEAQAEAATRAGGGQEGEGRLCLGAHAQRLVGCGAELGPGEEASTAPRASLAGH